MTWRDVFVRSLCLVLVFVAFGSSRGHADDWPEWRGKNRAGLWAETGILEVLPPGGPRAAWRVPVGSGYSGPAVADGRVFVTDSRRTQGNRAIERVVALDEASGRTLWTHEWDTNYSGLQLVYAIGPRATPTVDGALVYVVGTMGQLFALEVATGRVAWQKDYVRDFNAAIPSWGIASAPLVDGDRLICVVGSEPNGKVLALDKKTGAEVWRALPTNTEQGYNQPIIIEAGGTRQLILFHASAISSLDPVSGKVFWEFDQPVQMGIVVATPVHRGPYLLFTSQYSGALMLKLDETKPGATLLWKGLGEQDPGMTHDTPDTFNSVISTPVLLGEYVYGLDNEGQLRCLRADTGKLVWKSESLLNEKAMYGTAFFVQNGERFFINNDRGELVIANLSPGGFEEVSRAQLVEPTHPYVRRRRLPNVLWSHAAYANKHVVIRNDKEIARFSLAKESP